jgi:hypothetical protein
MARSALRILASTGIFRFGKEAKRLRGAERKRKKAVVIERLADIIAAIVPDTVAPQRR